MNRKLSAVLVAILLSISLASVVPATAQSRVPAEVTNAI